MHLFFLVLLIPWFFAQRDRRDADEPGNSQPNGSDTSEARLYRLAAANGGTLTVSDVVVDLGIPVSEAQLLLESMVDDRYVRMSVSEHGAPLFEFPELMIRH